MVLKPNQSQKTLKVAPIVCRVQKGGLTITQTKLVVIVELSCVRDVSEVVRYANLVGMLNVLNAAIWNRPIGYLSPLMASFV